MRQDISSSIWRELNLIHLTKNSTSCMEFVSFASISILWEHLETLFSHPDNLTPDGKVWMTKENRGCYNVAIWNDNDPTTWRWQLDHIVPQSLFDFSVPEQIKKCWSLENLRPYSAKQNVLDGVNRTRHNILEKNNEY